eukprot:11111439-Alexandrium_andersonii.AAC.1
MHCASIRNPPFRACLVASNVRIVNSAGPRRASTVVPEAPELALCAVDRADSEFRPTKARME